MNKFEEFCTPTQDELFDAIPHEVKGKKIIVPGKYIMIIGQAPVMLLSHLDTVHREPVSVICESRDGNIIMSPQGIGGDDRCGVYATITAYRNASVKPWLLFLCDEESGGRGAKEFAHDYRHGDIEADLSGIKFLVEFDRKGNNDAVYYSLDNKEFEAHIERYGFKKAYGSYSDICDVAPALGVAAVNLSSGYYNAHTQHEYVNRKELNYNVKRLGRIIADSFDAPMFEYAEENRQYHYASYQSDYRSYAQYGWSAVFKDTVPSDLPKSLQTIYEDLLDVFTKDELEDARRSYGNSFLYELYEDSFGPFSNK